MESKLNDLTDFTWHRYSQLFLQAVDLVKETLMKVLRASKQSLDLSESDIEEMKELLEVW